ncbi:MAG: hypothetical protein K2N74_01670 [Clostridiales bacterium]|nr:hypothetical protein [Clostridiales bacterium]
MKILRRTFKIIGCILAAVLALFFLLYAIFAIIGGIAYRECKSLRETVCRIPDLGSGFAPQGIAYSAEEDLYILTGYDGNNVVRLYLVKGDDSRRILLKDEKGDELKGHAGGVACTKDRVYVAGSSSLYLFSLQELLTAEVGSAVAVQRTFFVDNNAAYCHSDGEFLYVGEFYRASNYKTAESHHFVTPNGDENKAIVSRYRLDESGLLVEEDGQPYPISCISVTGLVQGFALTGETCVLSRSYGLKNSELEYHTLPKDAERTISVKFSKNSDAPAREVPLYYLDATTLKKTLILPAFSEDVTVANGKIVVTNESAANKYVVGKLFGANKVYSFPLEFNAE